MLIRFGGHGLSHPRRSHRMDKALLQAPRTPSQDRSQAPLRAADFRLQHFQNLAAVSRELLLQNPRIPPKFQRDGNCFQSSEEMLITLATKCVFGEDFRHLKFECQPLTPPALAGFRQFSVPRACRRDTKRAISAHRSWHFSALFHS